MAERGASALPPSGFGPALRRIREERALTQRALGEAAQVHPNTIAKMERGEVEPSWQMVLALSTALGVPCTAFTESASAPEGESPAPLDKKPRGRPKAQPEQETSAPVQKPRGRK